MTLTFEVHLSASKHNHFMARLGKIVYDLVEILPFIKEPPRSQTLSITG